MREELERKDKLVSKVRDDKATALKDAEGVKGSLQETRDELVTTTQSLDLAVKELEVAMQAKAKAEAQMQELSSRYGERVDEAKSALAAKLQMAGNLAAAKTQVEGVRRELMELKEAHTELQGNLQKAIKEKESLNVKVEERAVMLADIRAQLAGKEREIVSLQGEKSKALSGEAMQRGRATEMASTIAELERKLEAALTEKEQAMASIANIKGQVVEKTALLSKKEDQLDTYRAELRLLQSEVEQMRAKLQIRTEELEKEVAARKAVEEENVQLVKAHAPFDTLIEELRGLVKSLEGKLKAAQDERNKVCVCARACGCVCVRVCVSAR